MAAEILRDGLTLRENRTKGGQGVQARRTTAERSAYGRDAALARWARRNAPTAPPTNADDGT
jgi:hypothetical protein